MYLLMFLMSSWQYIDQVRQTVTENLKCIAHAPSVQMQDVPKDLLSLENTEEPDPDVRNSIKEQDEK